MPTAIWKSRLRSGSAHCNLEVAVEVRQCPLRSGARGGGPAVPTGIWSSRWRSGSAHWDLELAVETRRRWRRRRRRRRTALIKSNNPHLAGGEKYNLWSAFLMVFAAIFCLFLFLSWGMLQLGYVCLILGLCWAIVGYVGTSCWAILVYSVVCVCLC